MANATACALCCLGLLLSYCKQQKLVSQQLKFEDLW